MQPDKAIEEVEWWSEIARRKLNAASDPTKQRPLEWRWCKVESVGPDAVIVTGGIPKSIKQGKNKGRITWRGTQVETCVVTRTELAAEQRAYEAKAGHCSACFGKGQELARWTKAEGNTYRDCSRCKGSGKVETA